MRFPEFKGEWKETTLGKCVIQPLDYGMNVAAITYDGENKYIRITDIDEQSSQYISDSPVSPAGQLLDKYIVEENDILFARTGASTGKTYLYKKKDGKLYFAGFLIRAKIKTECNSTFIFAQTKTVRYYKWVRFMSIRSGQPGINSQEYASYRFLIPQKEEQDKIAKFLSLLDSRIEAQIKIIEKYESLIKGIGNKLFSLKMRFKTNDGNDFPSWKTKSFENIGKIFNGLSGKAKEDFGIGKPYIQYKQVFDSPQIQIQNCGLVNVLDNENQNNVKYGDILFTVSSETPDEIGMSSVLLDEVDEMYLNSFCFGYRLSSFEVLNPLYASYFFRDSSFRNKLVKIAQGSTRYNISKSEFIKLEISLPCIEEQARIASFLSAVDEKIKEEKGILALYLTQKSYLLRQMFI